MSYAVTNSFPANKRKDDIKKTNHLSTREFVLIGLTTAFGAVAITFMILFIVFQNQKSSTSVLPLTLSPAQFPPPPSPPLTPPVPPLPSQSLEPSFIGHAPPLSSTPSPPPSPPPLAMAVGASIINTPICTEFVNTSTTTVDYPRTVFSIHTPNAVESIAGVLYSTTTNDDVECKKPFSGWMNQGPTLEYTCGSDIYNSFAEKHLDFLVCAKVFLTSGSMFLLSRQAFPWPRDTLTYPGHILKLAAFDGQTHNVCSGSLIEAIQITYYGYHNIQEMSANDCTSPDIGEMISGYNNAGHVQFFDAKVFAALPGQYRYFKCGLHCNVGARFVVGCIA